MPTSVTLTADLQGIYEVQLKAGEPVEFIVEDGDYQRLQVVHHDGDRPIYVGLNHQVTVTSGDAQMVVPGTWLIISTAESTEGYSVWVVSAAEATVSLVRA